MKKVLKFSFNKALFLIWLVIFIGIAVKSPSFLTAPYIINVMPVSYTHLMCIRDRIKAMLDNYEKALPHPNSEDLQELEERLKKL